VTPFSKTLVKQIADQFAERFRLLIWICYYTGMRPSEALGLTMDQLDFENGQIVIDRQLSRFTNVVHEKYLKTTKSHRTDWLFQEVTGAYSGACGKVWTRSK
jgi:integrase